MEEAKRGGEPGRGPDGPRRAAAPGRDYGQVLRRVEALAGAEVSPQVLAQIEGYPIVRVRRARRLDAPTALLMAGTHGDEPAGVEAVLAFLERGAQEWAARLNFEAIICLNAYGYVRDQRHNAQGVDINWAWSRADVPEIGLLKRLVEGRRFEFILDFHEDWESPGFYLYELRRNGALLGRRIAAAVAAICPLNEAEQIEGMPAAGGVVAADPAQAERQRGRGVPIELFYRHTDHLLTTETPTGLDMAVRVAAHLAALEIVLAAHLPAKT